MKNRKKKGGKLLNYINLNYGIKEIEGVELPSEIVLSLETRGKRSINHRFNTLNQEIEIRCTTCGKFHNVFQLQNGLWIDVNCAKYWISTKEHTNLNYFSDKCYSCYQNNKKKKNSAKSLPIDAEEVILSNPEVQVTKNCTFSSKNDRIQQTIALSKENDYYVKANAVINSEKKNDFLNKLIDGYRANNRINL